MSKPLDPFSEVVDSARRWTPDWYSWLTELSQSTGTAPSGNEITALTGDVTASGPGSAVATIAADAVTNAKLADMPANTIKGNNTAGTANPVNLTAAQVITLLGGRLSLTTATIFYVAPAPTGVDSPTRGTTVGLPWATLQYAYDTIIGTYDFRGQNVTIQLANGTYARGLLIQQPWTGGGILTIRGDPTTPANVTISTTTTGGLDGGWCIYANVVLPAVLSITGFKLQTSVGGVGCIGHNSRGFIFLTNLDFGPTNIASQHVACFAAGGFVQFGTSYTISGGAGIHYYSTGGWVQAVTQTCTVRNLPVFNTFAFSSSTSAKVDVLNMTFVDQNAKGRRTVAGTTTAGNAVLTGLPAGTANALSDGMAVVSPNVPTTAVILSRNVGANTVTMNVNATTGGATTLKFEIARGAKFGAILQSCVNANGAGLDYLPGDVAGSADAGQFALYV